MKKLICVCVLAALFLMTGCSADERDYFSPFKQGFVAQLEGTFRGMAFAARLEMEALQANGSEREATLIFYAPESIADTVLARRADGTMTLSSGGVTVGAPEGYAALFSLFPISGEVVEVSLQDEITCVVGRGFSLYFDGDGTPTEVANEHGSARILSFSEQKG